MIVQCIMLGTPTLNAAPAVNDGWITLGHKYAVLGVYGRHGTVRFRILGDNRMTPALHNSEHFEIVSATIPLGWIYDMGRANEWRIVPKTFSNPGFWTAYFDGDMEARRIFSVTLSELEFEQV